MKASVVVVIAGLAALPACNSILGIGNVTSGAPADAAVDAPGTPDAGPSDVHGTAIDTYTYDIGKSDTLPEDLSSVSFAAYVPDGKGGFTIIDGSGAADGTFTIPQVPAGRYYLCVNGGAFYDTTSRTPDLGIDWLGRAHGAKVTKPTPFEFKATIASAATENDQFGMDSFAAHASSFANNWVQPGGTALDIQDDWMGMAEDPQYPALLQAGEDLWVEHWTTAQHDEFTPPLTSTTLVETYQTTSLIGLTDGQAATVTGSLTAVPQSHTQMLQIEESAYLQGLDVPPDQPVSVVFRRRAGLAGISPQAIYGVLSFYQSYAQPNGFAFVSLPYGDPYPANYVRHTLELVSPIWTYLSRGTDVPVILGSSAITRRVPTDNMTMAPFAPAPHNIKVGGVLASSPTAIPFDGAHAVDVSWAPPAGIHHYEVIARALDVSGNQASLDVVATFDTDQTSVSMPASLFTIGGTYVIDVLEEQQGGVDFPGGQLRRIGFPLLERDAVTARLLFASSCGNHQVDAAYEECDEGGVNTATCNADCTKAKCGDGVPNSQAGEVCDTGRDSVICDSDCTAVMCGDGHANLVAGERCDKGGLNGGSGSCCSISCQLVPPATSCP